MKAIMFAALGLCAVATPTTMWMASDMRAIAAKEAAKLQERCAQRAASESAAAAAAASAQSQGSNPYASDPRSATAFDENGTTEDECAGVNAAAVPQATAPAQSNAYADAAAPQPDANSYAGASADPYATQATSSAPIEYPAESADAGGDVPGPESDMPGPETNAPGPESDMPVAESEVPAEY